MLSGAIQLIIWSIYFVQKYIFNVKSSVKKTAEKAYFRVRFCRIASLGRISNFYFKDMVWLIYVAYNMFWSI